MIRYLKILFIFLSVLVFVPPVYAINPPTNPFVQNAPYPHGVTPPAGGPINDVGSFLYILTAIVQFAEAIFWILTVGFGLYGAYLYLFAAGNSEQASRARKVFVYAAIAALLAIVAYGVPGIVTSFVLGA